MWIRLGGLSDIASVAPESAENLSQMAKDLAGTRTAKWMTAEQAATYLGCESVEAFVKIVARENIPKHYLSARTDGTSTPSSTLGSWIVGEKSVDKTLAAKPGVSEAQRALKA